VTVGPREGELWVIEKGLQPNERVVAEGVQALSDGMQVRARPVPTPDEPQPEATSGTHD
jgi:multidrug efflux pump subunit AcrA (membrane-fusion protein)